MVEKVKNYKESNFTITLYDTIYDVNFKTFKDRVVKCTLMAEGTDDFNMAVGIAKCNPEFDTFNELEGRRIALEKARQKVFRQIEKRLVAKLKKNQKEIIRVNVSLQLKCTSSYNREEKRKIKREEKRNLRMKITKAEIDAYAIDKSMNLKSLNG